MNKIIFFISSLVFLGCSTHQNLKKYESQTDLLLSEIKKVDSKGGTLVAPRTIENNQLKLVPSKDWTSGFFGGELWYLYELTKNEKWKQEAEKFTKVVEQEKLNGKTHDMGFKVYCSFGNAYRITNDEYYKNVIIEAGKTLATRFNPKVGCIRSWDHNSDKWDYPVIIDNMLNLELLFETTRLTNDSTYHKIAVSHANTTLKNHFRPDNSCYHVISYDPNTGEVVKKNTHQGYSHESAWARGQGWAIYGFTMCYRYTKDIKYLEQAEKVADYILNHKNLPNDLIPYWDFDAPQIPNEPRDVSAGTVIASGLFELSSYSKNVEAYKQKALVIMKNITTKYECEKGTKFGFLLDHSTGGKPLNFEIDVPIIYADYYYLEAILRQNKLK